jgi:hypothetical protein
MGHLTDARAAIQAVLKQIQTDWTAYPLVVELDNRDVVDQATQSYPYLSVQIVPMGGGQADIGARPLVEQRGQILLYAAARVGTGAAGADALLDFLTDYFDMKTVGPVRCHAVVATEPHDLKGWHYTPAIIDYWYHRQSK